MNILNSVLIINLIVLHYQNSKVRRQISTVKSNITRQQQLLNRNKTVLYNLSHPFKIARLCEQLTNYRQAHVAQFIHKKLYDKNEQVKNAGSLLAVADNN